METHLFNENETEEKALCGTDSSADNRIGVGYYMEQRKNGFGIGTVCEACKVKTPPFAYAAADELEALSQPEEAEAFRWLGSTLLRETGQ